MRPTLLVWSVLLATCAAFPGCNARKDFPDTAIGWHSPSFNTVFGRLVRVPAADPDAPPTWLIRFGGPNEPYQGELALTSPSKTFIAGYSGGERIEVKGRLLGQPTTDAYNGRWYVVESIQIWSNFR